MKNALQPSLLGSRRILAWTEVLLIFLLFFAIGGSAAPDVNEAHYLAKARHYWDTSWCPSDFFLASVDAHTVFYWTLGWLTQFLSLTAVAWTGRTITWLLLAWSWRRLSVAVVPGPWMSLLTAGLYTGLLRWGPMAGEWVIGGVEAKSFSYVFVFLGLEAIVRRRWRAVWLLLGAATSFHVLVGGWSFVAAFCAWIATSEDRLAWKSLLPWIVGGALFALPGLVPALTLTWGTDPAIVREANQIYVFERLSHHLVFHRLPTAHVVRFMILLGCWSGMLWYARVQGATRRLHAFVMGAVGIGVLGVFIDQATVGLAVVGNRFGFADLYLRPLVAALLRYYWFRLSDVMVPLGAAFLMAELLQRLARSRPVAGQYCLAGTVVLVMLHVGEIAFGRWQDPRPPAVIQSMTRQDNTDEELARLHAGWRTTCAWIANNTPGDALFLTPRNQQTFKWDAQRGEVVNWKDIPQDACGIMEWHRRTGELYPRQVEQLGLVMHGEAALIRLSKEYGFEYVVMDRTCSGRRLNLRRVFPLYRDPRNPFEVYRMPAVATR
ncbi:MAG: DUF6798 domain-containing protein [Pirellulaceae bacterium]